MTLTLGKNAAAKVANEARKFLLKLGSGSLIVFIILVTFIAIFMERRELASMVSKEEKAVEESLENMTGFRTV